MRIQIKLEKRDEADIFKGLAEFATTRFLRSVNIKHVKCVVLTGSLATEEGTILKSGSSIITSDLDIDVFIGLAYYLICRKQFRRLSEQLTCDCKKAGFITNIFFHPKTRLFSFSIADIYFYEYRVASKVLYGEIPTWVFKKMALPTKDDAFGLVFSSISDYLSARVHTNWTLAEKIYTYAKRSLTLLYAALIIQGIFTFKYQERVTRSKSEFKKGNLRFLKASDLIMLSAFANFKLSGRLEELMKALDCKNEYELLNNVQHFTMILICRVLYLCFAATNKTETSSLNAWSLSEIGKRLPEWLSRLLGLKLPLGRYLLNILVMPQRIERVDDQKLRTTLRTFCIRRFSIQAVLNVFLTYHFLLELSHYVAIPELRPIERLVPDVFKRIDVRKLIQLCKNIQLA